jgi:hypothetical protein
VVRATRQAAGAQARVARLPSRWHRGYSLGGDEPRALRGRSPASAFAAARRPRSPAAGRDRGRRRRVLEGRVGTGSGREMRRRYPKDALDQKPGGVREVGHDRRARPVVHDTIVLGCAPSIHGPPSGPDRLRVGSPSRRLMLTLASRTSRVAIMVTALVLLTAQRDKIPVLARCESPRSRALSRSTRSAAAMTSWRWLRRARLRTRWRDVVNPQAAPGARTSRTPEAADRVPALLALRFSTACSGSAIPEAGLSTPRATLATPTAAREATSSRAAISLATAARRLASPPNWVNRSSAPASRRLLDELAP